MDLTTYLQASSPRHRIAHRIGRGLIAFGCRLCGISDAYIWLTLKKER